jgi:hypothetical protein
MRNPYLIGVGVRHRKLGLVVKHFFEVWNSPLGVGGIAVETTAELVVYATATHSSQRGRCHLQGIRLAVARVTSQKKNPRQPAVEI